MPETFEEDEYDDVSWIDDARAEMAHLFETLEFDPVSNEAGLVLPVRYKRDPTTWFSTLEEMHQALAEHGDSIAAAGAPFEGGVPVFEIDTSDIVLELLERHGVSAFFAHLRPPAGEHGTRIFLPQDFAVPEAGGVFRVDTADVNRELIDYLAQHPNRMHDLTPRKFEELVAELFRAKGYDVELTRASRDDGRDVICTHRTDFGTMLLYVECKKYGPNNPVGVEIVRSLYGVVESARASHGIIATTSRFTSGAVEFHRSNQYRLSLQDFDAVSAWLRDYRIPQPVDTWRGCDIMGE